MAGRHNAGQPGPIGHKLPPVAKVLTTIPVRRIPSNLTHVIYVIVAAAGCVAPTAWVAFPAACLLVLWLPGRLLVQRLRQVNQAPGRPWLAVAASIVLMPVLLSWVWRFSNDRFVILGAVLAVNAVLLLLTHGVAWPSTAAAMFPTRRMRRWFAAMLLYVGICVFGSYWLPSGCDRVGTRAARDYVKHHAVLLSLELHPLPLHNVFYAAEADTPCYYYEYHYYLAAALRKLADDHVSIAFAFAVTSALLAMVFIALVYLVARALLGSAGGAFFAAACVGIVGGWDVLPVLVRMATGAPAVVVLDSWIPIPWRIHNLMTQYMWCPQHIAAIVTLMLAAVWLRQAPSARWWIILAPLMGASIFGSSAYLAITIFPAVAIYLLLRLYEVRRDAPEFRRLLAAVGAVVILGAVLMGVQAWQYHLMNQRFPGGLTLEWDRLNLALLGRLLPPGSLANLLDAPWILLVDLGLPGVACLLVSRRVWSSLWQDPGTRLLLVAGAIGTLALFTVRSNISPFDYSFRVAIKPAQVVAAICAGALLAGDQLRSWAQRLRRGALVLGVLLGLPVGFYEAPLMAVRSFLLPEQHRLDAGAIRFLRRRVPRDAIVQGDPIARVRLPQLIDRQMGVLDPDNSHIRVFFPEDEDRMRRVFSSVTQAFATSSSQVAHENLQAARVTHVLAGSLETARYGDLSQFDDPKRFKLLYRDEHARVYRLLTGEPGRPLASQPETRDTVIESP